MEDHRFAHAMQTQSLKTEETVYILSYAKKQKTMGSTYYFKLFLVRLGEKF